ncbi:MAG TPA: NUDIX domain-containing protein [Fibrobacteria bacterium]|nr:NUDIX domain-containing protein [Fibrobacteria bacterium]
MPNGFDTAVLIGRFQPFHSGHAALLAVAFRTAPRVVMVLGSAHAARTPRNPFTAAEREAMIRATLTESDNKRLVVAGQRDVWDVRRWSSEVRAAVEAVGGGRTALVGHRKDHSSSYLGTFPEWTEVETGRLGPLDATPLREWILSDLPSEAVLARLAGVLPAPAVEWIAGWMRGPWRGELAQDRQAILSFGSLGGRGPFVAMDAVVRSRGRVLLTTRGHRPGRGLEALPGGFPEPGESLESGARRVLARETGIVVGGDPVREAVFSHPDRSQRARIATNAFLFEPDWEILPEPIRGGDVGSARWVAQSELPGMEDRFFEDHFHILDVFLGLVPGIRA